MVICRVHGDEKLVTENDRKNLSFGSGKINGGDSSVIPDCFKAEFKDIIQLLQ